MTRTFYIPDLILFFPVKYLTRDDRESQCFGIAHVGQGCHTLIAVISYRIITSTQLSKLNNVKPLKEGKLISFIFLIKTQE